MDFETGIQDYGMRIYNPNLGRFLSVDPITRDYPELTPYQFAGNTPIQAIDLDGLEPTYPKRLNQVFPVLKTSGSKLNSLMGIKENKNTFGALDFINVGYFYGINYKAKEIKIAEFGGKDASPPSAWNESASGNTIYGNKFSNRLCAFNCVTSFNASLKILYNKFDGFPVPKICDGNMTKYLDYLSTKGIAGPQIEIDFKDVKGKGLQMNSSMSQKLKGQTGGEVGFHLFGLSMNDGEHSIMIAVEVTKDKKYLFHIMDNTPLSKGFNYENSLSADKFDEAINNEATDLKAKYPGHGTISRVRKLINTNPTKN